MILDYQDPNDERPILHISLNTFHQWKCFVCVIICNYPGRPHMSQRPSGRVSTCYCCCRNWLQEAAVQLQSNSAVSQELSARHQRRYL